MGKRRICTGGSGQLRHQKGRVSAYKMLGYGPRVVPTISIAASEAACCKCHHITPSGGNSPSGLIWLRKPASVLTKAPSFVSFSAVLGAEAIVDVDMRSLGCCLAIEVRGDLSLLID